MVFIKKRKQELVKREVTSKLKLIGISTVMLLLFLFLAPSVQAVDLSNSYPIAKTDAAHGAAYSSSLAANATDPESDPLFFSKVTGPAWLSVAANGDLSGTPRAGDVGSNAFTVKVEDGQGGSDTATLNIKVCGSPDINGGGVNFADFEVISRNWLAPCFDPSWCEGADLDLSGLVDMQDLKTFTQSWVGQP
jgi:hypothetical protein